jgi:hypothetical protein
LEEIK